MDRRIRSAAYQIPRRLLVAAGLLLILPFGGTTGYMVIEGWGFLDALYMTVTVITTIGFREVHPLDNAGRIFTIFLALFGVATIFYGLISVLQFVMEGELGTFLGVQRMKGRIQSLRDHYVLCGFGRVGEEIAREFVERDLPFVVVESNTEAIERAQRRGYPVLVGDATSDEVLKEAGVEHARCLLAASDSDAGNTFIVLTAKALNAGIFVVSRAAHPESEPRMQRAGAERVFSPYVIAGRQMALSALHPLAVEFIDALGTKAAEGPILAEVEISQESGLPGRKIQDVLHGSRTLVVLGLQKADGTLLVGPAGDSVVEQGDRVILMGEEPELESIRPAVPNRPAAGAR